MARWICVFDDDEGMLAIRERLRAEHHAYLRSQRGKIIRAGALVSGAGEAPTGALWILDVADRAEAVSLVEQDPYFDPRHRRYRLYEWKLALPDWREADDGESAE